MNLDFKNLEKMIAEKYISVQKHPDLDLYIYNYTQKAQFDQVWNNETLQCRGLILDGQRNVVAKPFPKFFNYQEIIDKGGQIPAEDFIVTEKMDGSLGILYKDTNGFALATRGSFVSDQAIRGTRILRLKYQDVEWNPEYTHLFEIIYPENRIVVDYGKLQDIVLLAVVNNKTGEELPYEKLTEWASVSFNRSLVKKHDGMNDFSNITQRPNSEGYVVFFPSSKQRFKIKFEEYVRLHRLITGVNKRRIWDLLRNNQPLDELLERVPDEIFAWVKKTVDDLNYEYNLIESIALKHWEIVKTLPTRKDQAIALQKIEPKQKLAIPIVFKLLDKKPYSELIWKLLKPKHETPFKMEI